MKRDHPQATDRLQLRRLTLDDVDLMLNVWNDPAFVRYVGDRGIRTIDDARQAMQEGPLKLYSDYGYGPYRLALREDDTPVGICGLFRRDGFDEPDIGFSTLPGHTAMGYGYEAACTVVEYAQEELEIPCLTAIVSPENAASIGLIRKLGFSFERMYSWPDDARDVAIYRRQLVEIKEK